MCCDSQCRTATEQRQKANQQNPFERASNWSAVILVNDTSSDIITFYVYLFGMRLGSRTYTLHTFTRTRETKRKKKKINPTSLVYWWPCSDASKRPLRQRTTEYAHKRLSVIYYNKIINHWHERSCIFNTACSVCSKIDMAMARWRRRRPYHILPFHFFFVMSMRAIATQPTKRPSSIRQIEWYVSSVCSRKNSIDSVPHIWITIIIMWRWLAMAWTIDWRFRQSVLFASCRCNCQSNNKIQRRVPAIFDCCMHVFARYWFVTIEWPRAKEMANKASSQWQGDRGDNMQCWQPHRHHQPSSIVHQIIILIIR